MAIKLSTGDVMIISSNSTIMDGSRETLLRLKEKHPDTHPDRKLPLPPEGNDSSSESSIHSIVTREEVRLAIKSFRNESHVVSWGFLLSIYLHKIWDISTRESDH